uniref:Uncharacterized protein n=1 Tax=Ditylenchus dipsaci TaxID=166011 RepID=A0A915CY44_9BILA
MVKGEKKERKKSGKVISDRRGLHSGGANQEGDGVDWLLAAVLAVLDLPKEDADSWKDGKVRKLKKQNDADKDKPVFQEIVVVMPGNQNESRPANPRAAREPQGPRQPPIAPAQCWPPPVDLETKDEELDWRNGQLVYKNTVPSSPAPAVVFTAPKNDKPTFAEIAANKKTMQILTPEPKFTDAHDAKEIKEFQLDDHHEFPSSDAARKTSIVPSVVSKSPPVVLKTDIGFQPSGQISEFAVAARVKSLQEDGEFFGGDEPKQNHFCSLEETPDDMEVEKAKEASRVDKQTEVITQPIVYSPPVQQQQPPVVQNMPLEFQHLSQVHQQMVIALAAQLASSLQFNSVVPGNLREAQAPLSQNMPVSGSVLDAQQPSHSQGRMMPVQQMLQPRVQPGRVLIF